MKHCILAKYRPEVYPRREELLPRIREIFAPAAELPGVHSITVYPNCVARENRYDVLIVLDMASEALPVYDVSAPHRLWKEEFGPLLAQKAIFDFEPEKATGSLVYWGTFLFASGKRLVLFPAALFL